MDQKLKRRLLIAIIIVALAVIFLPMPFAHLGQPKEDQTIAKIPPEPEQPAIQTLSGTLSGGLAQADQNSAYPSTRLDSSGAVTNNDQDSDEVVAPPSLAAEATTPKATAKAPIVTNPEVIVPPKAKPHPTVKKPVAPHRAKSPTLAADAWVIQVASFPDSYTANQMVKKIKQAGYPALSQSAKVKGKTMYRVYSGPYASQAQAKQKLAPINHRFQVSGYVHQIGR